MDMQIFGIDMLKTDNARDAIFFWIPFYKISVSDNIAKLDHLPAGLQSIHDYFFTVCARGGTITA